LDAGLLPCSSIAIAVSDTKITVALFVMVEIEAVACGD